MKINSSIRSTKLEYLRHLNETVAVMNKDGEYAIKPTKFCSVGDVVWVLEADDTFTKITIY
jgi:hypothetical protein